MFTSRGSNFNENYYTSRKKILNDFLNDEEAENMKYIEETESLVSQTKLFLKDLVSGQLDFESLNDQLDDIQAELESDCNLIQGEISTLQALDKQIEKQTVDIQKKEEAETKEYHKKIEELKKELESKEFTIQNMERLYIELENVIKNNISQGNEQLLTMEQFNDFISQNDKLKQEIKMLEDEKDKLTKDYNNLLKENLNLRSKDESFEVEKIKDALNELSLGGNNNKGVETKIKALQEKYKTLSTECSEIEQKIKRLTNVLKGLNIDNNKFNQELMSINQELNSTKPFNKIKRNKSFTSLFNEKIRENMLEDLRKNKNDNSDKVK